MDINLTTLGIAGAAMLVPFWQQAKNALAMLRSLAVQRVVLTEDLALYASAYLAEHGKAISAGDRFFKSMYVWVRPNYRYLNVPIEIDGPRPRVIRYRKAFVLVSTAEGGSGAPNNSVLTLVFVRGTLDIAELFGNIQDFMHRTSMSRYGVYKKHGCIGKPLTMGAQSTNPLVEPTNDRLITGRPVGFLREELGAPTKPRPFALSNIQRELAEEFSTWLNNRDWFEARGISWRRGWLLHGRPGTGKTQFVVYLAKTHQLPVFALDLGSMTNEDLDKAWADASVDAPCIVLIEEIDATFDKRKNVASSAPGALTFDSVLNCISGAQENAGVFVVVTTNNIDSVDSALAQREASRPGRIDRVVEIGEADTQQRADIIARIHPCPPEDLETYVEATRGMTAAQVCEYAQQIALSEYNSGRV